MDDNYQLPLICTDQLSSSLCYSYQSLLSLLIESFFVSVKLILYPQQRLQPSKVILCYLCINVVKVHELL